MTCCYQTDLLYWREWFWVLGVGRCFLRVSEEISIRKSNKGDYTSYTSNIQAKYSKLSQKLPINFLHSTPSILNTHRSPIFRWVYSSKYNIVGVKMSLRYDGKVAVITGAGRGLGKQLALFFASRGAKVVVNDLGGAVVGGGSSSSVADTVVQQIKRAGGQAVADYNSVLEGEKIIERAMKEFGRIDILVNNAGIVKASGFSKMTETDWSQTFRVHVDGAYKCTRAVWNIMREQGYGRIVNVSSAMGLYGGATVANYSSAKLALHGFTQSLALEGAKRNIYVNSVAPIADTRLLQLESDQQRRHVPVKPNVPLFGYLCHETSKENGSIFECGGGWITKLRWQRAQGVRFDPDKMTAELVAEHFPKICSFAGKNEYPTYDPNWGNKVNQWINKAKL